jgi:hypothetical protein
MVEFDDALTRFQGVDLSYRRSTSVMSGYMRERIDETFVGWSPSEWPGAWRARIVTSKNERSEYRVTTFGDTPEDAIARLWIALNRIDRGEESNAG